MRKDFLWGGATAANQYEGGYNLGGRGLSINDVEMGASHGKVKEIHETIKEGCYYPSHHAQEFILMVMMKKSIKMDWIFMMLYLMNA